MMDKSELESTIEVVDNWKIHHMIVVVPIFVLFLTMVPSFFIMIGKSYLQENNSLSLSNIEIYLELPPKLLLYVSFALILFSLLIMIRGKRNKFKAMYIIQIVMTLCYCVFYYQAFIAFQYFIIYRVLRYVNWFFFVISGLAIVYYEITKKDYPFNFFSKSKISIITKVSGVLWIGLTIFGAIYEGLKDLKKVFWIGIAPFLPLILIIISLGLFSYLAELKKEMKKVLDNQEYYRIKYDFSEKQWYGLKSKEYKVTHNKNID